VSGEAILSVENSGKPLGGPGSATRPTGGARSTPQTWVASPGGVGYNVPHFWSLWGTEGTMQY